MQYNWDWGVIFREPYQEWIISGLVGQSRFQLRHGS